MLIAAGIAEPTHGMLPIHPEASSAMCHAGVTPSLPHGGLSLQQQQQLPSFLQQLPLFLQQQQQQQQLKQLQQQQQQQKQLQQLQQQQQQLQQLQQQLQQLQQPLVLQPTSVSTPAPRTRRSAGPPASKRLKYPVRSTSALSPQNLDEVNLFWRLLPDFTSGAGQTNYNDMALEWNNQLSAMLQHGTQGTIRAKTHLNLKSFHEWFVRVQARAASERTSLLSTSQSSAASLVAAAGVPGISASGMAAASAGLRLLGLDLGDTGPSQGWALPSGPGMQSGMPAAPPATAAPARRKPARRGSLVCFAWLLLLLRCLTIPSTLALAS